MQERTYNDLPSDVRSGLSPDRVRLDPSIPYGVVDVASNGGTTRLPVNAFVRMRRKSRKAERQNRRAGRA